MNRRDLLLAILSASNGQPYQPVQIQKAVFLVSRNLPGVVNDGPGFAFAPYDYGPFDSLVYSEAEALQREGLATVVPAASGWRTYAVSQDGLGPGRALLESLPEIQRDYIVNVSEWVRKLGFADLVKSIYEAYPEQRVNSVFQG